MEKADWLEKVYALIEEEFESEHLPRILDLRIGPFFHAYHSFSVH